MSSQTKLSQLITLIVINHCLCLLTTGLCSSGQQTGKNSPTKFKGFMQLYTDKHGGLHEGNIIISSCY